MKFIREIYCQTCYCRGVYKYRYRANTNNISLMQEDQNITICSCGSPMSPNLCKSHRYN